MVAARVREIDRWLVNTDRHNPADKLNINTIFIFGHIYLPFFCNFNMAMVISSS